MVDVWNTIYASFDASVGKTVGYLPQVLGAFVILVLGFFVGRFIGKVGAKLLDKVGVDNAIEKTPIGDAIKTTKMSVVNFMDAIIRWFIYLIFIVAAVDVLNMAVVSNLIQRIVLYLPNFFSGIVVLVGGIIVVDVLVAWIDSVVKGMKIEGGAQVTLVIRVFLFLIITILAMDQLLIDTKIIYTFLGPFAWAAAIVVALRYGLRDALIAYAKELKKR